MHGDETLIWLPGLVCDEAVWSGVRAHASAPGLVVAYPDARSIDAMAQRVVDAVAGRRAWLIGHSMGGASAMLAVQLGLRTETLVSIAAPSRILGVLRGFARMVGMPPRARSAFIRQVEQDVGMRAATLDVAHYQLDMPGLIVHAEDDTFVPVSASQVIHDAWFDSR